METMVEGNNNKEVVAKEEMVVDVEAAEVMTIN
jgi:hypothetical protein